MTKIEKKYIEKTEKEFKEIIDLLIFQCDPLEDVEYFKGLVCKNG